VKDGLVATLSRPGGNVTGVTRFTISLGVSGSISAQVPQATTIAYLGGSQGQPERGYTGDIGRRRCAGKTYDRRKTMRAKLNMSAPKISYTTREGTPPSRPRPSRIFERETNEHRWHRHRYCSGSPSARSIFGEVHGRSALHGGRLTSYDPRPRRPNSAHHRMPAETRSPPTGSRWAPRERDCSGCLRPGQAVARFSKAEVIELGSTARRSLSIDHGDCLARAAGKF
jgi:hypothetical protein